ncbi:MAG: UbiX family decarboxylase associated with menaquinone via futalosine [Brockia lithotrophica]|uniref:Flavin prenyltransferase UbiX n=1 Tax=Brockia lithotrophica TaxID=933949 RepID=A0A2T5G8I4_9BACL|nr:MAG: UbiX family decarboxylase associated with menaquinone via futalosine [Brockia lithotrophica]
MSVPEWEAPRRLVVGVTGASGAVYARRLVGVLRASGVEVHLVVTDAARRVFREELGWDGLDLTDWVERTWVWPTGEGGVPVAADGKRLGGGRPVEGGDASPAAVVLYDNEDVGAPVASGSFRTWGMVVVPCSMGTLGRLAAGSGEKLLERAADVALKEGRPLVLVPRETPLTPIHLENMLRLARSGAAILPAMPAFYHRPRTVDDLVNFVVGKILDRLYLPAPDIYARWGRNEGE